MNQTHVCKHESFQNSVRYNLSLRKIFVHVYVGSIRYWTVDGRVNRKEFVGKKREKYRLWSQDDVPFARLSTNHANRHVNQYENRNDDRSVNRYVNQSAIQIQKNTDQNDDPNASEWVNPSENRSANQLASKCENPRVNHNVNQYTRPHETQYGNHYGHQFENQTQDGNRNQHGNQIQNGNQIQFVNQNQCVNQNQYGNLHAMQCAYPSSGIQCADRCVRLSHSASQTASHSSVMTPYQIPSVDNLNRPMFNTVNPYPTWLPSSFSGQYPTQLRSHRAAVHPSSTTYRSESLFHQCNRNVFNSGSTSSQLDHRVVMSHSPPAFCDLLVHGHAHLPIIQNPAVPKFNVSWFGMSR